jgi:23S rRNA (adenine2503-C2)-methyltransferase
MDSDIRKINLKSLSAEELTLLVEELRQKPYRARQIAGWIYGHLATSIDEMTSLSKSFREELKQRARISNLALLQKKTSGDGSEKFLFALEDGEMIESVLMPDEDRLTLCVSSQVGCAMGCRFCATGMLGLNRNLKSYEITDQIISVSRLLKVSGAEKPKATKEITNIVFMGMGEPLDNLNEVIKALRWIVRSMGFSGKRVTLSTAGIIPGIETLGRIFPAANLAVSLNAASDTVRSMLMPVNRRFPLNELIHACRKFPLPPRRKITFEYILLEGVNDSTDDAVSLAGLLRGIRCKINLIPYNRLPDQLARSGNRRVARFTEALGKASMLRSPSEKKVKQFQKILQKSGMTAMIRRSRGQDISAACGQLRANHDLRN